MDIEALRYEVHFKTSGKCAVCGRPLKLKDMTMDHYIPKSLGGADRLDNLYPACGDCNAEKSNYIIHPNVVYPFLSGQFKPMLWANFNEYHEKLSRKDGSVIGVFPVQNRLENINIIDGANIQSLIIGVLSVKGVSNKIKEVVINDKGVRLKFSTK